MAGDESGAFQSHDRSLIQLLNDFEKPLSFYPVIDLSEGAFRDDDLFYRRGMTTPYLCKAVLYNSEKQILSESIFFAMDCRMALSALIFQTQSNPQKRFMIKVS